MSNIKQLRRKPAKLFEKALRNVIAHLPWVYNGDTSQRQPWIADEDVVGSDKRERSRTAL